MATDSGILAWKIPWTEKPGGLQSLELQRVGYNKTYLTPRIIAKHILKKMIIIACSVIFRILEIYSRCTAKTYERLRIQKDKGQAIYKRRTLDSQHIAIRLGKLTHYLQETSLLSLSQTCSK